MSETSPPGTAPPLPRSSGTRRAGWGWMAANLWRAVADRLRTLNGGGTLRLGTIEIAFAAACLAVCVAGLVWTFADANRL